MQKRLMAVAVAGALAAPAMALAQSSTVQLYGTVIVNYNRLDNGNGLVKTDMINAHDANIGVKGEEKLGGNLSAWFQCESSLALDSGGGDGLCARNSGMGFKGAWGNAWVGTWDTPMKIAMAPLRPFSTSGVFGMGSLLWNESGNNVGNGNVSGGVTGAGTSNSAATSFTRRQNNSVNYQSANIYGFTMNAMITAANEATGTAVGTTAAKPRLYGLSANYKNGPLYLAIGMENHVDFNPTQTTAYAGGTDTGWSFGAGYNLANLKLSAIYTKNKYEYLGAGRNDEMKVDAWGLYADWSIAGPHGLRLGYSSAGDTKGTMRQNVNSYAAPVTALGAAQTDTGADLTAIQYYYSFSKRTELNFGYASLNNDRNSRHRLQTAGARNAGQDQDSWTVGIKHRF